MSKAQVKKTTRKATGKETESGSGPVEKTNVTPLPQPSPAEALGQVVWLMRQSELHKHLFLADLDWLVMPALQLKQFRLIRKDGQPIAYASWAYLNEESAERMTSGEKRMRPGDWKTGEELWLVDLIAPFGGQEAIMRELKEKTFEGKKVKTLQLSPDGNGTAVVEW